MAKLPKLPPNPFLVAQETVNKLKACTNLLLSETVVPWEAEDELTCEEELAVCLGLPPTHLFWDLSAFIVQIWNSRPFHDIEVVDVGFDVSSYPKGTNEQIIDKVDTYQEFLLACSGTTEATYCPGAGISAQKFSSVIEDFIRTWIHDRFAIHLQAHGITSIECLGGGKWDCQECLSCEVSFVTKCGDIFEDNYQENIISLIHPYVECCYYEGPKQLPEHARFKDWTLWDFQTVALAIHTKDVN